MKTIQFYDLAGADDNLRFSPFCWRVRMALAHKGLAYDTIPWRFSDKGLIAQSGQGAVPVVVDGDKMIHDSWTIANYLEESYPDRPLFGNGAARGAALTIKFWAERALHPLLSHLLVLDVYGAIAENDRPYFRESREKRFGMTLEQWTSEPDKYREQLRNALEPVRLTVGEQKFIGGSSPAFADYIVFGALQWARCVSTRPLLEKTDPVYAWRERLLDAFNGMARTALARESD
jgi:glutathione S-transferase